jgi:CubicO group peptidase (beta-lactamase class C family)
MISMPGHWTAWRATPACSLPPRDLAVYAQVLLDAAQGRTNPLFPGELYNSWLSFRPFDRPLGWDAPTGPNSSAGQYFTHASFGHTGFTGTSIWIDPERHLFVVLLTNRLNPTARNQRHLQLRRDLHDAVQLAIDDMVVTRRGAFPGCDPAGPGESSTDLRLSRSAPAAGPPCPAAAQGGAPNAVSPRPDQSINFPA